MSENDWIEEVHTICSLPRIDILKYLWSKGQPVDTHTISDELRMPMEDVYQHLKALELHNLVKMESAKTKTGDRRYWSAAIDKFSILINADKGNFTYRSSIKEEPRVSIDIINATTQTRQLSSIKKIDIILYLVAASIALSAFSIALQFIK